MSELTKDESAWLKKVNALLKKCPSDRLGFYTIGDPTVAVYDKDYQAVIDDMMDGSNKDFGTCVDMLDASLGELTFPSNVHSTAG